MYTNILQNSKRAFYVKKKDSAVNNLDSSYNPAAISYNRAPPRAQGLGNSTIFAAYFKNQGNEKNHPDVRRRVFVPDRLPPQKPVQQAV